MPIVEHAEDWSKLAELLPQLSKEYAGQAERHCLLLILVAMIPPLLLPMEAAKWFSHSVGLLLLFTCIYTGVAYVLFRYTRQWVENVRGFAKNRIAEEGIQAKLLDRIERDAGKSEQMSFDEIYLIDGSGLERRTRKHIIYAENDIEMHMDRGQKLFANNNVPLMINTAIIALFCIYTIIGGFIFASDDNKVQGVIEIVQRILLILMPLAIYIVQNNFRLHLFNQVLADELLGFIAGEPEPEPQAAAIEAGQPAEEQEAEADNSLELGMELSHANGKAAEDAADEGLQAQA